MVPSRYASEQQFALRRFFGWLEHRFGGLPIDPKAQVIVASKRLQSEDLQRLFQHKVTAIHVREFFDKDAAKKWGDILEAEVQAGKSRNWKVSTSRGLESSDVYTLGEHLPLNVASASNDVNDLKEYFDGVIREFDLRRKPSIAAIAGTNLPPMLWPLDLLRLQLDEAWPAGAGLGRETAGQKRPFGGGLPRIMKGPTRWKQGFIHVDEMSSLNIGKGLFSANIYLKLPDDPLPGCKEIIRIWPLGIRSRWDWYRNAITLSGLSSQDPEAQMRLRSVLGPPAAIRAEPGDLVLLSVQRPHEAVGFQNGTRISLQCFIEHKGLTQRLLIDT
jgi:hypothetical protein